METLPAKFTDCVKFVQAVRQIYLMPSLFNFASYLPYITNTNYSVNENGNILHISNQFNYFQVKQKVFYTVEDPLGFSRSYNFWYTFYDNYPRIRRTIADVSMHANQFVNYYIPPDFYEDADGALDSITIQHSITSACDKSWLRFSRKLLRFSGRMPVEKFKAQSTVVSTAQALNYFGAPVNVYRRECRFRITVSVRDAFSPTVSSEFSIYLYNHDIYQVRPLFMRNYQAASEFRLHINEPFQLNIYQGTFKDEDQ